MNSPNLPSRAAPDFARAASDYASHRPPFAPRLFEKLRVFGIGLPGQQILDIGAGTGLLGRSLIAAGSRVIECEPSLDLLRFAESSHRVCATAERLPFADSAFEAVTAAQCWHWFDRRMAPQEIFRVLKPGRPVAVIYQTHLPLEGSLAHVTEELILRHLSNWRHAGGVGVNGQALKDLQSGGFVEIESFTFDVAIPFTAESWAGYVRTWSAVAPRLGREQLIAFESALAATLQVEFAEASERWVLHRVFVAIGHRPL